MAEPLWALGLYFGAVLIIVGSMLGISWVLGERHREPATDDPYESGIIPTGSAQIRLPVQFYLMAMFFVIFDLESVFIYAWAVAVPEAGWMGFWEMLVFIGILFVALAYLWRVGALDWGISTRRVPARAPVNQEGSGDELVA